MTSTIAVLLSAIGIPATTIVGYILGRRKVAAETNSIEADASNTSADAGATTVATALSLIGPMKKRIDELDAELTEMRALMGRMRDRIDELEMHDRKKTRGIHILTTQITDLGVIPGWPPEQEQNK